MTRECSPRCKVAWASRLLAPWRKQAAPESSISMLAGEKIGRDALRAARPKVLILTGPTGVGKTETSLSLAEHLNGEIVSADSVQVYRGLDVGADKLPGSQRRGIPHHLIDILDPSEEFSAGDFHDRAHAAIRDILGRGRLPIVVGGTGFYLRVLIFGKPQGGSATQEDSDMAQRLLDERKARRATTDGVAVGELEDTAAWEAGVQVLVDLGDPDSAARIAQERNNWYRLKRAVEILLCTNKPLAQSHMALQTPWDELQYDFRPFFLTRPRLDVFQRIDERVERMVLGGLLPETLALQQVGLATALRPAARALGYRQAFAWLNQVAADRHASTAGVQQLVHDIAGPSRRLHRAQLTFARNLQHFHWVDATAGVHVAAAHIEAHFVLPEHTEHTGNSGRLSKAEQDAVKRYQTRFRYLDSPEAMKPVLDWLLDNGLIDPDAGTPT